MKIVSYNISLSTPQKIKQLFDYNADVYVVPEIAAEEKQFLPSDFEMEWNGINFKKTFMGTKSKGLGIIWRKESGKLLEYEKSLTYAIPLIYNGVFILGFWPTHNENIKSYTKIARSIIERYSEYFGNYKQCIITGDFNLYYKKNAPNKDADILEIDALLSSYGFKSAYHEQWGEPLGSESQKTFYFKNDLNNPFFLDYTYSKEPLAHYELLLPWNKNISDHVGQLIVL